MKIQTINITPRILLWGALGLFLLGMTFLLRDIVALFIFAFIFSAGLRPLVDKFETKKFPRLASVLIFYIIFFIVLTLIVMLFVDAVIEQVGTFIVGFPDFVNSLLTNINNQLPEGLKFFNEETITKITDSIRDQLNLANFNFNNLQDVVGIVVNNLKNIGETGLTIVGGLFNALVAFFVFLVTTAYLSIRKEPFYIGLLRFFKPRGSKEIQRSIERVEISLGEWLRGQISVMLIIGVLSYIALVLPALFGISGYGLMKFALILAIIAGVLEALPNIGPALTAFITVLFALALGQSVGIILYVLIAFSAIQQFEGLFVVPLVMKKAVDLDPLITVLGVMAGLQLYGIPGAILSIPIIVTVKIVLEEYRKLKQ